MAELQNTRPADALNSGASVNNSLTSLRTLIDVQSLL
jgi:hypothetical protein